MPDPTMEGSTSSLEASIVITDDPCEEEHDDIDDDEHMAEAPVSARSDFSDVPVSKRSLTSSADEEDHHHPGGVKPPRPSPGRQPIRVKSAGTGHRRRTRRETGASKEWGNASSPAITLRDLMGSEKKATQVGMARSVCSQPGAPKVRKRASKKGAENKRAAIRSRKVEKVERKKHIDSSLSNFLSANKQDESDDEEEEDISLISGDHKYFDEREDDDDDDARSIKSTKSHTRRRVKRQAHVTDGNMSDGQMQESSHSKRRAARRKGKLDEDDTMHSMSRRSGRRPRQSSSASVGAIPLPRTNGEEKVEQKPKSSRRNMSSASERGEEKPRSTRKKLGVDDDDRSVGSRKHRTRRRPAADDDDRSVGSRKSVGARRRRHQQQRSHRQRSNHSPTRKSEEKIDHPPSPEPQKPRSGRRHGSPRKEGKEKVSLSQHIDTAPPLLNGNDPEEKSENSSRFSSSYNQPPTLIQFDPTNANNFTMLDQGQAHVTSEKIKHADGTESELHISEIAGLPTFETPQNFHDSLGSAFSGSLANESARSLGSDYVGEHEPPKSARSLGSAASSVPDSNGSHQAGQSEDEGKNPGGRRGRGAKKNAAGGQRRGVSATRSFLSRMRRQDRADRSEKPPRKPTVEDVGHDSRKGFFGWNKRENDSEEEDTPMSSRFFKSRRDEAVGHQMLDDDGSE